MRTTFKAKFRPNREGMEQFGFEKFPYPRKILRRTLEESITTPANDSPEKAIQLVTDILFPRSKR